MALTYWYLAAWICSGGDGSHLLVLSCMDMQWRWWLDRCFCLFVFVFLIWSFSSHILGRHSDIVSAWPVHTMLCSCLLLIFVVLAVTRNLFWNLISQLSSTALFILFLFSVFSFFSRLVIFRHCEVSRFPTIFLSLIYIEFFFFHLHFSSMPTADVLRANSVSWHQ